MQAILVSLWVLPLCYSSYFELLPAANVLEIAPLAGVIGLIVGLAWGTVKQQAALCWFVISPVLSHVMVVIGLSFAGQMELSPSYWLTGGFLLVQLAILGTLTFRLKGMRIPSVSLSIFGMSYAPFGAYVAGMALTDTWL